MKFLPRSLSALLSLVLLSAPLVSRALPDRTYEVTDTLRREIRNFIRLMEEAHYNREAVTPASYPQVIENFMEAWDGQHLFFLDSDREEFVSKYADGLYWNISSLGRIDPAFDIYSVYERRADARAQWVFRRLEEPFDFTGHNSYRTDRSELETWPADAEDADAVWERRLTFEVLGEILNDKTEEEARERVRKRYERMLKNLADIEMHEISEQFLTQIAQLYDPHSTYFSADTYEDFAIQMRLQLVGIGALLGMEEDECVIREIIAGGPADLDKRLKPNDKILAVSQDGGEPVDIIGMKLRKIVDMIRGNQGTKVHLTIQPADAVDSSTREEIVITRDVVNLDSARARGAIFEVPTAEDGKVSSIGVISLPAFYGPDPGSTDAPQNSASGDVAKLIDQLTAQGIDGLVLDLRDNGGGLLSEAINLTGLFIESGPVVQVRSYYGDIKVDNDEDTSVRYAGPLAVLVSRFSASASEIVAGALQNYGRAVVLGDSSTHGKGTVQTVVEMANLDRGLARTGQKTGATKLTIQKFYLPSGSSTQLNGVVPDIVLPSIEDVISQGERDLPQALVWDEIPTSFFDGAPIDAHILQPLLEASRTRQESLEEFDYLRRNIDWFRARQEEKDVSLNLELREEQQEQDKTFREAMDAERDRLREGNFAYREFLLTPPKAPEVAANTETVAPAPAPETPMTETEVDTAVAAEAEDAVAVVGAADQDVEETEEEPEPEGYARLDIHLREALRVVSDAVEIGKNPQYAGAEAPPLTARTTTGG